MFGNLGQDLHFFGGRYGILTRKPSAAWQYTLIDSTFEGQRDAAIREDEAQLTVIHCQFRNLPTAIAIDQHYSDQLWVKDSRSHCGRWRSTVLEGRGGAGSGTRSTFC